MGRKSRRAVYDPSIMDRMDAQPAVLGIGYGEDPDPLAFDASDSMHSAPQDLYEQEHQEILDPKLHGGTKRNRGRFICLMTLVSMGIFAIIVTVSVIIAKQNRSPAAPISSQSTPDKLPPPPKVLGEKCNKDVRLGGNQFLREHCEMMCRQAECCNYPSNLDLSCLRGNEEVCMEYHRDCLYLDQQADTDDNLQISIPPAPATLPETCSTKNLITEAGVRTCSNYCVPNHCCYETGVASCRSEPNCVGYTPCLNLRAHDMVDPTGAINAEVDYACSPSRVVRQNGRQNCRNKCKLAECCYRGNKMCYGKPAGFCNQYSPCSILYNNTLPVAIVDDMVDDDQWDDDTWTGDDDTWAGDDDGFDDDLADDDQSDDQYDDDGGWDDIVDDDAGDDGVTDDAGDAGGMDDGATDDNANDDANMDDAIPRDENLNGLQFHPVLQDIPAELSQVCNPNNLNFAQCTALCDQASCCNFPERMPESCLHAHHLLCLQWTRQCAVLVAPGQAVAVNPTIEEPPDNLYDMCSASSLATEAGYALCNQECNDAKCCWSLDENVAQCRSQVDCNAYSPCLNLRASGYVSDEVTQIVQDTCTDGDMSTEEGRAACKHVCFQHRCCLRDACRTTMSETDQAACPQYNGCYALFNQANDQSKEVDMVDLADPPSNLSNLCSDANLKAGNTTYCKAACDAAKCCDIPENLDGSCLREGTYGRCAIYHRECAGLTLGAQQNATAAVPEPPAELDSWCSTEGLATQIGRTGCKGFCMAVDCCWSTTLTQGESCRDNQNCPLYASCLNYRSSWTTSSAIANEVDQKCTASSLQEPGGLEACRSVCGQHTCCWSSNQQNTRACFGAVCDQYDGCQLLAGHMEGTVP